MKPINKHLTRFSLLCLCLLSACGGGAGKDQNSSVPIPVMAAPVVPADLQKEISTNYPVNSQQAQILAEINGYRSKMGLGPLNQNVYLDQEVTNHQAYMSQSWKFEDEYPYEISGRAGFTGIYPLDRAKAAGWSQASWVADITYYGNKTTVAELQGSNIRSLLMDEQITDVGIAASTGQFPALAFGYAGNGQTNASDYIGTYPLDRDTGIPLSLGYLGLGSATVAPANKCFVYSYPISLQSQKSTQLTLISFAVREFGSTIDLSARVSPSGSDSPSNIAYWVGNLPFKSNTTYNVHFVGKVNGGKAGTGFSVDKSWSFTTGRDYPSCL